MYDLETNFVNQLIFERIKKIISIPSVKEGDKLTVRFTDVGEGWLQCEDAQGQ